MHIFHQFPGLELPDMVIVAFLSSLLKRRRPYLRAMRLIAHVFNQGASHLSPWFNKNPFHIRDSYIFLTQMFIMLSPKHRKLLR